MVDIERYKMHICLGNLGVGGREKAKMVGTDKHKMHICQGNLGVGGRETQDGGHWGIQDAYMPRQPRSGWQRNPRWWEISCSIVLGHWILYDKDSLWA